jgi:hypothetical protein
MKQRNRFMHFGSHCLVDDIERDWEDMVFLGFYLLMPGVSKQDILLRR